MRKVISLIILIVLLFTNIAYPLTVLRPPIGKDKKRIRKAANNAVYSKIAKWIKENIGNKGDARTIIAELKRGKLVFEYKEEIILELKHARLVFKHKFKELNYEFKVDFATGFYSTVVPKTKNFDYSYDPEIYIRIMLRIPKDISKLASKVLRKNQRMISEYGIDYLNQNNVNLISSIGEAWELKFKLDEEITEHIVKCLRSLGRNALTSGLSKKIITKKLLKLQLKIPEAKPIICERALELLEIDRENFREGLKPFIGNYIVFRDAIREIGLKDDTAGFYNLFDEIVAWMETEQHKKDLLDAMHYFIEEIPEDFTLSETSLLQRKLKAMKFVSYDMWVKIYWLKKNGVDFRVKCEYAPEGTFHVATHWAEIYGRGNRSNAQVPEWKDIIYSSDHLEEKRIYSGKVKHEGAERERNATFTIVFPEPISGQYEDVKNMMSGV